MTIIEEFESDPSPFFAFEQENRCIVSVVFEVTKEIPNEDPVFSKMVLGS